MKKYSVFTSVYKIVALAVCSLTISAMGAKKPAEPVKIIFDTDMIQDFDDVGAMACLHAPDAENGRHLRVTEKMPKAEVGRKTK